MTSAYSIRLLGANDAEGFVEHVIEHNQESGADGDVIFMPYSRTEPYDKDKNIPIAQKRWSTPMNTPGWRRCFAAFHGSKMVGHVELCGGLLRSDLHRVELGMGLVREHRRQGLGTRLLEVSIEWLRAETDVVWLDLGVFAHNAPAIALYQSMGFVERGRTPDQYRVEGTHIENINMSLYLDPECPWSL
tara:strand:- start:183 stop:749 length:567 start_codon:yes stop_codon:yes gene_type:complete